MAYGSRGLGSRSRGSSRRDNVPPGRTGELCTGRSATGGRSVGDQAVREMRMARLEPALTVGPLESWLRSKDSRSVRRGAVRKVPDEVAAGESAKKWVLPHS